MTLRPASRRGERGQSTSEFSLGCAGIVVGVIAVVGILWFVLASVTIDAGHIGIVREWGALTGRTLPPGLHWVTPFVNSVDEVDTRVRQVRIESYTAASQEQQDLFLNLTLNYHVDPNRAPDLIQNVGSDFEAKIVVPRFLDIPKSVTDDYPTSTVLNSRDEIRQKSTDLLRAQLEPFGLIVDNISFENFSYSPEYNAAIEARAAAEQQVQVERQKTLQQAEIAKQKTEIAKGEAQAQIERAKGESESNRLISESLTQEILMNRYIEKLAPGVKSILVPSENGFILDLGQALNEQPAPTQAPQP